ncbi:DUF2231 domain-containing protein [Nitriliruptor alkaliphilus]|uniref:DUF2231 domain-containing protein n=1 Tax=Nitriliruptor alkaliphilus TaxID=427918 RepID=UPI000698C2A5|nr:DUF2231 domain-containing protein [Nitriliruptor alkaliphilus]
MNGQVQRPAAKEPLTLLAGPYGHPFHPLVVTVPIGAWVASMAFDLASRWATDPHVFATGSRWLLALGVVGAVVAAMIGVLDLLAIPGGTVARRTGYLHMSLNLLVTALYTVSFLLRNGEGPVPWSLVALSVAGLGGLAAAGWLGGELTYRYGIRVVDETTQAEGFSREERS